MDSQKDAQKDIVSFWIETEADGVCYPGIVEKITIPLQQEDVRRILVVSFPQHIIDREDLDVVLQLGDFNLAIRGKVDEEEED